MIFHSDTEYEHLEMKPAQYEPIACDCWFTAGGRMIPRFFKVREDDETYQITVQSILKQEEQYHVGIPVTIYTCLVNESRMIRLHYFHETHIWKLER